MSQSKVIDIGSRPRRCSSDDCVVADEGEVKALLALLEDAGCRAILEVAVDSASANELSDACDIPLSTVYRKIDMLTDAGLLAEGTRIRRSGNHTSEYSRCIEEIEVSVGSADGFELNVTHCDPSEQSPGSSILGGR